MDYIDDYAACEETYATFQIYPSNKDPDEVTNYLGIKPSKTVLAGMAGGNRRAINGWFLSTKGKVSSKDSRRHIDWLLDKIQHAAEQIRELKNNGARVDICCFWISATGNGGPVLSPRQMTRLSDLDLDVWWDIWFSGE